NTDYIQQRPVEVLHGRIRRILLVPSTLDLARPSTRQQGGNVIVQMQVAVAQAGAIEDHHMVEYSAVTVRRILQFLQEIREHADMVRIDFDDLCNLLASATMVRQGVV